MTDGKHVQRHLLLAIFVLSGFAGLIYQSVWSHYLGLFLGHAAYAQALVLALFMGGMAIGAAWIAKVGTGWRNLLRGYAIVELVIGVLGIGFHTVFTHTVGLGYDVLIPLAGSAAMASVIKWLVAALLILPQTILLGMTFPLMSGGLIRRFPGQEGGLLGGLYFTNSIGAAIGALASVFVLIPAVGLPGTSISAGLLNFLVAALAWWLAREPEAVPAPVSTQVSVDAGALRILRLVLFGTAISGAASFVYEIVWIRMLGLAVGSTQHAFELMLASFIAGIALGGLWIRKRADRSPLPLRLAGWMQIAMGLAALASLVLYANAFEWVGWLLGALSPSEGGYALFNLGTGAIAIAIMLPAAFFAGTTLPLFTVVLLRAGFGERSIGRVYAWNTMGSIVGVIAAIHLLIPVFGLKLALCVGALVDMGIGLVLLRHCVDTRPALMRLAAAAAVVFLALGVAITQVHFDPMRLASGVFRHGKSELDPSNRVVFYRDGKTASISVIATPDSRAGIATNGKIDAGLTLSPDQTPASDELTMILAAALPLAMHPSPEQIGIIGFGSGLTTHTSLGDPRVQRVETVEIEEAMVQGASLFMPRVHRAYGDPRSAIVIDDAKAWFASRGRQYDIIISEPSNPWVSGVGALFSTEFYEFIPQQLKADGLFVQWIQLYEVDDRLVSSILNALTPVFGDYAAWLSNGVDLIIIATPGPTLPPMDYERVLQGVLGSELAYLGITRPEQLAYRKVADARLLRAMGALYGAPANSDYYPLLSLEAPRTRFMRRAAGGFTGLPVLRQPVLELLGIRQALPLEVDLPLADLFAGDQRAVRARQHAQVLTDKDVPSGLTADDRARLAQFRTLVAECPIDGMALSDLEARLAEISEALIPHLPPAALAEVWRQPEILGCRTLNPSFDLAMAVVDSLSARDPLAMRDAGEAWLAQRADGGKTEAAAMDETALISAMSAAAATADWAGLCGLEARFGGRVPQSSHRPDVRALLRALAANSTTDPMAAAAPGIDGCRDYASPDP